MSLERKRHASVIAKCWQLLATCVVSLVDPGSELRGMVRCPSLTFHVSGIPVVQYTQDTYGCFRDALYFFIYFIYFCIRSRQKIRGDRKRRQEICNT